VSCQLCESARIATRVARDIISRIMASTRYCDGDDYTDEQCELTPWPVRPEALARATRSKTGWDLSSAAYQASGLTLPAPNSRAR
jgi:hypothetical protein